MDNQERRKFDRYLSRLDVWAMAFGCMVGWGTFVMPGTTFLPVAGPLGAVIGLVLGALFTIIIGANFSYLMVRHPGTGGVYAYTREAFGKDHAFLCSWFLCLSYMTIVFLNSTALFSLIRTVFGDVLQGGYRYTIGGVDIYLAEVLTSLAALLIFGVLFLKAKPFMQHLLTALSLILFAGAVIITLVCLPGVSLSEAGAGSRSGIFTVLVLSPWAFVGFDTVSFDTTHFNFSIKKSKGIVPASIIMAGVVYAGMCLVSASSVPARYADWMEYIADLPNLHGVDSIPTFFAAHERMGTFGLVVLSLTALAAILTGIICAYRATTRVLLTMSEDSILSEKFSSTSYSILFVMGISAVISFLGENTLLWFVQLTSFGAVVGFGYTSASAWKIARKEKKLWIMVTGIIGTVTSVVFALVHLIPRLTSMETMGGAAFLLLSLWCLLGFFFYLRTINHSNLSDFNRLSTSGVVLFSLLLYSVLMWFAKRLMQAETTEAVQRVLFHEGIMLIAIIFLGLGIMLYVQNLFQKRHDALEREKILAVEGSQAKSRFLFNMSHDIRTPLNAIIGFTNLAIKEEEPERVKDYLKKVDASSHHLLALINDVLEMSRIENGKLELDPAPVNLSRLMDEIRDMFSQQMAAKEIHFTVDSGRIENPYVLCDEKYLNRVLLNLISNAYKFTSQDGHITVTVTETDCEVFGRYVFRIRDNGIGMSKEFAEKMFTAFERERTSTVSKVEGTGLGLAITKSIVDLMGGSIEVNTAAGEGTEFRVTLQFEYTDPVIEEKPAAEGRTFDFAGRRVLLVEDNPINREIAKTVLEHEGMMVETAENGQIAVEMVETSQLGYYTLVLMDIQMPVMDGYTATREIRALDSEVADVPIVAMTANAFKEDEVAAIEAGMQAHIAKPFNVEQMMQILSEVLTRDSRRN